MSDKSNNEFWLNEELIEQELQKRPLSGTLLDLKWLAEKFRKKMGLKRKLARGEYTIESDRLAKCILNRE